MNKPRESPRPRALEFGSRFRERTYLSRTLCCTLNDEERGRFRVNVDRRSGLAMTN